MNWGRFVVAIAAAAVLSGTVFVPTVGWAQALDTDLLESEAGAVEQSREAAGRALDFRALDDAPVTYQEVLKDPDNVELNFRFARTQVSQGNFRGASATLERILRLQPTLAPVRLLYAIVLFRLDNYAEAEREFEAIKALKVDQETAEKIDLFLDRIRLARRTTRYAASVSFGGQYDTNRTTAPRSNTVLANNGMKRGPSPMNAARSTATSVGFMISMKSASRLSWPTRRVPTGTEFSLPRPNSAGIYQGLRFIAHAGGMDDKTLSPAEEDILVCAPARAGLLAFG